MPDREKVIDGINKILEETDEYDGVLWDALALLKEQEAAYQGAEELLRQKTILFDDAIKRLKKQEAVEPEVEVLNEIDRLYRCPRCHKHFFYEKQKYCDQCGQAVKWDEC